MDNPLRRQRSDTQRPTGFLAVLYIFDNILPLVHKSLDLLKENISKNRNPSLFMRRSIHWLVFILVINTTSNTWSARPS